MIVAKTALRKLPKTCKDCKLSVFKGGWEYGYNEGIRICSILKKECPMIRSPNNNMKYSKRDDCPLVEME